MSAEPGGTGPGNAADPERRRIIAFVGSREGAAPEAIQRVITAVARRYPDFIITSGAGGRTDLAAAGIGRELGHEVIEFPADWRGTRSQEAAARAERSAKGRDPLAGFERNDCILGLHPHPWCRAAGHQIRPVDGVVAFMGERSPGTRDSVHKALRAGIPVLVYDLTGQRLEGCRCDRPEGLH